MEIRTKHIFLETQYSKDSNPVYKCEYSVRVGGHEYLDHEGKRKIMEKIMIEEEKHRGVLSIRNTDTKLLYFINYENRD